MNRFTNIISGIGVILLSATFTLHAFAADRSIEVLVEAGFEPTKSIGLLISSSGTIQKKETKITRRDNATIIVAFAADDSEIKEETTATAIVVGANGEQAWGEVTPIQKGADQKPWWDLPECPKDKFAIGVIQDESALESLVQIRAARRKVFQEKLARELEGGLGDSIATTEEFFGLKRDVPVNPDLSPDKLADRFTRLTAALNSYLLAKEREKKAAPTATTASEPESTDQADQAQDTQEQDQ